jgi:hypothetical protein
MNVRVTVGSVSRPFVLVSAISAALFLGVAASASAGTLDQQQTSSDADTGLFDDQSAAQTFTAGSSGVVDQVDLSLFRIGNPPNPVTVEIRSTSAGEPGAAVLASASILVSAIPVEPAFAFVPVTFATPAPVTAGTQYAIVAYSATTGDAVGWRYQNNTDPYSGGAAFFSADPHPPGPPWNEPAGDDYAFKTYVAPAPPASPSPSANTGQRAAALKKCKKRAKAKQWSKKRLKKCKKRAKRLPV